MWMYDNYRNRHPLSGRYLGYWGGRRAWWKHRGDRGGHWNGGKSHGQHHEARPPRPNRPDRPDRRSEEHTSELQSLMRISYAVFCLKKKTNTNKIKPNRN